MPVFGNPAGFLALLAIPAILAIHFLQRESRHVVTSTFFLLEQLAPESAAGRRFERLRNSLPLWLQLAAALLAAWLLVDPRWVRPDAAQHVLLVLDGTVSMTAFHDEMIRAIDNDTQRLSRAAARTEWQVIETDTARPTVYAGPNRDALMAAIRAWQPHLGAHDPAAQIQAAQSILGGRGTLVFVTDRKRELPSGVRLLAVGHPFDHCGFCGVTIDGSNWKALVRNYGTVSQHRRWWIEANGEKSKPQDLTLEPGSAAALAGAFPAGASHCELVMDADAFPLDSRLPILVPRLKRLAIQVDPKSEFQDFFKQYLGSLDRTYLSGTGPDITLAVYDPLEPELPKGPAIVFVSDSTVSTGSSHGVVTAATANPLSAGLNWSGLLAVQSLGVPVTESDETLVWQGDQPMILLRHGAEPLLIINFDLHASNASELPAFVILLHRFAEQIRGGRIEEEARNLETNEAISVAFDPRYGPPIIVGSTEPAYRAPAAPCFFKVSQAGRELLDGAVHFADARAADFRNTCSADDVREEGAQVLRRNSQPDLLAPVWMLMLGVAICASWGWRRA